MAHAAAQLSRLPSAIAAINDAQLAVSDLVDAFFPPAVRTKDWYAENAALTGLTRGVSETIDGLEVLCSGHPDKSAYVLCALVDRVAELLSSINTNVQ